MKKEELQLSSEADLINWKSFLDNFYQPIIISNNRGNHLYVNKAACSMTGYSESELIQLGMRGLADPDRLKELAVKLKKRLNEDPIPHSYDFQIIAKNGEKIDVRVNGHKILWGKEPADLVALYNIGRRKKEENWFHAKSKLSDNLSRVFSTELCFKLTCRAITDERLFARSVLVMINKDTHITNVGYHGVSKEFVKRIKNNKPFTEEAFAGIRKKEFKIGDSYFLPDGKITKILTGFIQYPDQIKASNDLTNWQPGDLLLVPLFSESNTWIGHLTVGDPCDGKRPDLRTVRKLEEFLYIVSKRLTEIKHQEMIYDSEQRYRAIAEQSVLPIAIYFKEHYIYVNKAFCELFGYSREDILNCDKQENRKLINPADLQKILEADRKLKKTDEINKLIIRGIDSSGEIHWLERFSKKINYYGVESQLIILIDRTREILSERQLQISEEQARTLLNSTEDAVLLIDTDGKILNLNQQYANFLDEKIQNILDKYIWEYFPEEEKPVRKQQLSLVIETKRSNQFNDKRGNLYLRTSLYPIFNEKQEVERVAVFVHDVTEEREITKKLFQAEKLAAIGNVTSGIVHQIRNPLGNISFAAQLGLQKDNLEATVKEYFQFILNDVDQANQVIQKLLEYNDPYAIEMKKGNILEPIYKAISFTNSRREANKIKLEFDHPDKLPILKISEYWLEQIFINLINNSIQAIKGKGKIEIKVYFNPDKTTLIITFTDNGCGIPKKILSQVSDPFFTTKQKGVGLGLSLVNKIVELHKGFFDIESQKDEYTTIKITLPLKKQKKKYYGMMSFPF